MSYRILQDCGIAFTDFREGQIVEDSAIHPGSIESAKAQGLIEYIPENKADKPAKTKGDNQ